MNVFHSDDAPDFGVSGKVSTAGMDAR